MANQNVSNITGYKFIPITNTKSLQKLIIKYSTELNLKGTVLISKKGLNFSIAGETESIKSFTEFLCSDKRFSDIDIKTTYNDYQPFRKMLVRIKKEIISMGVDEIDPFISTGDKISPLELQKKLKNNEDVVLLDLCLIQINS